MLGQTSNALQTAIKTTKKVPNYAPAHNCLGLVYFDLGKNKDAERHFDIACSIDPNYSHAQNNLANALTHLDQNTKAQNHYDIALRIEPKRTGISSCSHRCATISSLRDQFSCLLRKVTIL